MKDSIDMKTLVWSALLLLLTASAQAKDLTNRLGIGFKNQFSIDVPSIAAQYYPGPELGLAAVVGVDTQKNASRFGAMVKVNRVVFQEENLNFYLGAGAGLISLESSGSTDSGFQLLAYGGAEFFLAGLENLGFSMEFGPSVTSLASQVRFATFGDSPLRAGLTFYF